MGDILITDIDDEVLGRLRENARARGLSVQEVAREMILASAPPERADKTQLIERFRARHGAIRLSPSPEEVVRAGRDER